MGQIDLPDEVVQAIDDYAQQTDWADGPDDIIEDWARMHAGIPSY